VGLARRIRHACRIALAIAATACVHPAAAPTARPEGPTVRREVHATVGGSGTFAEIASILASLPSPRGPVWLSSYAEIDHQVQIECLASGLDSIRDLLHQLLRSALIEDVMLEALGDSVRAPGQLRLWRATIHLRSRHPGRSLSVTSAAQASLLLASGARNPFEPPADLPRTTR
jgi:hypothetical protein